MSRVVTLEVERGVATITLDSPANRNALSRRLRAQLLEAVTTVAADDDVRVVVLGHTGSVFCAGADLKEGPAQASDEPETAYAEILDLLWHLPKPVVGGVTGPVRAGGLGLVAACDLAIVDESVTFSFTEVRIGVVPAVISAVILPRTQPAIQRYLLTGETFDAHRAAELGLVTHAVPGDQVGTTLTDCVEMLRLGGPEALAGTKRLLRAQGPADLRAELDRLTELSLRHFASPEAAEGTRSFFEKRLPSWAAPRTEEEIA